MNRFSKVATIMTLAVLLCSVPLVVTGSEGAAGDLVLLDGGDGDTSWHQASGDTYMDIVSRAFESDGHVVTHDGSLAVDGLRERTIGDTRSSWRMYTWGGTQWDDVTGSLDMGSAYTGGCVAVGFYPEGVLPTETPDYRSSWTMVRGDSGSSGHQTAVLDDTPGHVAWQYTYGQSNYVCSTVLVEGPRAYVVAGGGYTAVMADPTLYCYDRFTGEELWSFSYEKGAGYETTTGAVVGGHVYLPATNGNLYRIPVTGPGEDYSEVLTLPVPNATGTDLVGTVYNAGPTSVVYDSGVLYFSSCGGYMYCTDLDLEVIWKSPLGGRSYYSCPTVDGDVVYTGSLDGCLYAFDRYTGELMDSVKVYTYEEEQNGVVREYGGVNTPVVIGDRIVFSFSDGIGMNSRYGGIAIYELTSSGLVELYKDMEVGLCSTYILPVESDGFTGVYYNNYDGLWRMDLDGTHELMHAFDTSFKAPLVLVNGDTLYSVEYETGGYIYTMDLDGNILSGTTHPEEIQEWTMDAVIVIDGMLYNGTDGGMFAYAGAMPLWVTPSDDSGTDPLWVAVAVAAVLILAAVLLLLHMSRVRGMPPLAYINSKLREHSGFNNERTSKVARNKRRLVTVILVGLAIGFVLFIASLAYGPGGNYTLGETMSILGSAIEKTLSGQEISDDEIIVFDSRCSRAVAAFGVGLGLSISGSIYQAIIRNPMVDPYIMGVSAGAGVAAVATIAFDFTFFGLLDSITYVTPIVAMVGGVVAFGATMLLAEKSGGSSINYVLAGVIIGLVFSAVQTLMMSRAGDKLNSVMSWLFGSFANIDWSEALLILIPAVTMSVVSLIWAKEFNLVLLGEDQARQMGLDVRRFNRWMLILASVLASVCVAFVGIIGFVGLVVPHLCRMILGGDHRLVMPASMVVGGALMLAADLFAKMVMIPMELPVGAITTIIGAPVFAYLLIRKGRMYDG